jgi:hypothetical protein
VVPDWEKAIATSSGPRSAADIGIMWVSSKTLVRTPIRRNLCETSRAISGPVSSGELSRWRSAVGRRL